MFSKRLLFLSNQQLTAYFWKGGKLSSSPRIFSLDAQGEQAFASYLQEDKKVPIYILTDLVEENFQRIAVPHVRGEAHRNLVARRLLQTYRETPFRHATSQEREKSGRKDDIMLFSALTNADLLNPWVKMIRAQHEPLAGIYSIALLGPMLFRKLGLDIDHLLLVTRQSTGLRQSYFLHGRLRFSRLVPMYDDAVAQVAQRMVLEINKTREFLASTRLLSRDEQINIGILAGDDILDAIEHGNEELALQHHQYFNLLEACQLLGVPTTEETQLCDHLFLSVLAKHPPKNQYAPSGFNRHLQLEHARLTCLSLAGVFAACSLLYGAVEIRGVWQERQQALALDKKTKDVNLQYKQVLASMPPTVGNAHDMKSAVDIEQAIRKNAAQPLPLFRQVSEIVDKAPQIRINQMQWIVSDNPNVALGGAAPMTFQAIANAPPPMPALIGLPKPPMQILLIEGEVAPFRHDFRAAMAVVKQFSEELGKIKHVTVHMSQWPINLHPSSSLRGKAGNEDPEAKAKFALKLVWNPNA